jgi:apolipoprotein N-acyltransferase
MMSWLWLACGAGLLPFTGLQTTIALAGWLAPIFLLRFTRTVPARWALPAVTVAGALAAAVSFRGVMPSDQVLLPVIVGAVLTPIPYAVDRLLHGRLTGVMPTLVFPMADTALAFVFGAGEFGTTGHPASLQVGNLALLQSAAIAGQWAVAFLMAWTAAVVNEVWQRRFALADAARTVAVFGAVLASVLLLGGARLALDPPAGQTVRIAGIAPNRAASDALMGVRIAAHPRTADERAEIRQRFFAPLLDDLFTRTQHAANAGSQIVVWAEASAFEFVEDKAAVIERAQAIARAERIYLQIGVVYLLPNEQWPFNEIRAILFDPTGAIVWDYLKTTSALNDGNVLGPGILPTADTPYGRLAPAICFDANFPGLIRQAGRAGVDILLLSSSDWAPVTDSLGQQATLRAVENGMSVVRPARRGTSLAVDYQGRVLGQDASWFVSDAQATEHTITVNVPVRGVTTPYARVVGDVLGWLSIVGLLAMVGGVVAARRRAARTAPGAAAQPAASDRALTHR